MTTRPRDSGEFCWINILTPQPAAAQAFFAALLGWTAESFPGQETPYTTFKLGATVYVPVADAPGVGRFCGIRSPQGVHFMVMQYAR